MSLNCTGMIDSQVLPRSLDLIYEICRWSLPLYRVAIYDREFINYMRDGSRMLDLQKSHTRLVGCVYRLCGLIHRADGPALVSPDGEEWYQFGVLHRDGGPAVTYSDGPMIGFSMEVYHHEARIWYQRGLLHRVDGPAVEYHDGSEEWYQNGVLHRDGGPALVMLDDDLEEWYQNGELHRDDGPARIHYGYSEWYCHGQLIDMSTPRGKN